jgi:starvation-inducible DNA-binding protein
MDQLTIAMKIVLANTFVMYFKAHSYHWNVEGMFFSQLHDFFGGLYEDLHGAIDPIAEEIRALDAYAPISMNDLYTHKTCMEDSIRPNEATEMINNLLVSNESVLSSLNTAFKIANDNNKQGLADFIAGRIDTHNKHAWMLKAYLRKSGV